MIRTIHTKISWLKNAAMAGALTNRMAYRTIAAIRLKMKVVDLSISEISFSRMRAAEKPLSTNTEENSKKTSTIATRPKSSGDNNRASKIVTIKLTLLLPSLSRSNQIIAESDFSLSDLFMSVTPSV
jgi:hypothetical protein